MLIPASINDYQALARRRLPKQLFDYIEGGANDEQTLAENEQAYNRLQLKQRILRDVSNIDLSASVLGRSFALPVGLAPIGLAGSFAKRGEVQALKAAESVNVPFNLSTLSICSMEEIARVASSPFGFQLYIMRDRQVAKNLIQRAKSVGCDTLTMTVDLPLPGMRYRDHRNGLGSKQGARIKLRRLLDFLGHPSWLWDVALRGKPLVFGNLINEVEGKLTMAGLQQWVSEQFDASINWDDLAWLRDQWHGKLIVKGIMTPEDAETALNYDVDAIVISNHGGRQLDSVPATIDTLRSIRNTVDGSCELILDGGIRSGLDVIKALALGADSVMIGRPWAYALATAGQQGIEHMLSILQQEMQIGMALTGHTKVANIDHETLV